MLTVGALARFGSGARQFATIPALAALLLAAAAPPAGGLLQASAQGQTYGLTQGWYEGRQTYYQGSW